MAQIDRTIGLVGHTGIKAPVRAATTANIALTGEQTIDGVACATGDAVLVKDQSTGADNGIYVVDTGTWSRAKDFDGTFDVKKGSLVYVNAGTTNRGLWVITTDDPITLGTTSLAIARARLQQEMLPVACSDETSILTAGAPKVTFRMPYAMELASIKGSLTTAQGAGSIFTVDVNKNGTSILSTKLTIDNGEKTSVTAAAAAVLSDTSLAADDEVTIDIDQIGDGTATGLKVYLIGLQPGS
jgi:phage-related tail fiber protein